MAVTHNKVQNVDDENHDYSGFRFSARDMDTWR
jgi:hypothetical protein